MLPAAYRRTSRIPTRGERHVRHPASSIGTAIRAGFDQLHASWGWFVALGIAFIVLGAACILGEMAATLITVVVLGWLLLISGIVALVHAFQTRSWSGFLLYLLSALLRLVTGFLLIRFPLGGALGITCCWRCCLSSAAPSAPSAPAKLRFPRWGWAAASGIISVALGIMLLVQFPALEPVVHRSCSRCRSDLRGHLARGPGQCAACNGRQAASLGCRTGGDLSAR